MERERLPEVGAHVLSNLHWVRASDETRNDEGSAEVEDDGPGSTLLTNEFLEMDSIAFQELRFAEKANSYKLTISDPLFNPLFNDRELYTFVASLYLARHFADPVNRSSFLLGNKEEFTEEHLLKLVRFCNIDDADGELSPKLALITNRILETNYITHQPAKYTPENEHLSPLLQRLRERQRVLAAVTGTDEVFHARVVRKHFRKMEKEVVELYKLAQLGPRRHLSIFERCGDEQAFTLSEEEGGKLLAAARVNGFFYDLISTKPPEAKSISHEQALCECSEHARLWLLNSQLRVYYNFPFTYGELARGSPTSEELEAWRSPVGYKVRLPSCEEKMLRRDALAGYWEQPAGHRDPRLWKLSKSRAEVHDVPEKFEALKRFLVREKEENAEQVQIRKRSRADDDQRENEANKRKQQPMERLARI